MNYEKFYTQRDAPALGLEWRHVSNLTPKGTAEFIATETKALGPILKEDGTVDHENASAGCTGVYELVKT